MKQMVLVSVALAAVLAFGQEVRNEPKWELVWQDEFEGDTFDTRYWSKIPRGTSDWNRHMSPDDSLYAVANGHLILRGKVNTNANDSVPVITGGLYTKDKFTFCYGKIEIRAKLNPAKGAWPAFWMLPNTGKWPDGGEIDIMERLNGEAIAYQTVHSHYTYTLKQGKNPPQGATGKIDPTGYNVYAVAWHKDVLVFSINGTETLRYPKIETDQLGQWPFTTPFYILLDMQLGGKWVGEIELKDLPVEMAIDWVRVYREIEGQ